MASFSLNDPLRSVLPKVGEVLALHDDAGKMIGYFTLAKVGPENLDPGISDEEIRRRMQVEDGRPLRDILADLEKR